MLQLLIQQHSTLVHCLRAGDRPMGQGTAGHGALPASPPLQTDWANLECSVKGLGLFSSGNFVSKKK